MIITKAWSINVVSIKILRPYQKLNHYGQSVTINVGVEFEFYLSFVYQILLVERGKM